MSTNANARKRLAHELADVQLYLRAIPAVLGAIPLLDVPDGYAGPSQEDLEVAEALEATAGLLAQRALEELDVVSEVIEMMRGRLSDSANAPVRRECLCDKS